MYQKNYRKYEVIIEEKEYTPRNLDPERVKPRQLLTGIMIIKGKAESYIHIGSGRYYLGFKEQVRYNKVVIPGSTLKGLCRSRIQLLAVSKNKIRFTLDPSEDPPDEPIPKGAPGWRHFALWSPATWEKREREKRKIKKARKKEEKKKYSVDEDLFGHLNLSSRVFFGNLIAEKEKLRKLILDYSEKIFAIAPGTIFNGEITFIGLKAEELGLIIIGLRLHENKVVLIGRSKYRERKINSKKLKLGRLLLTPVEFRFRDYCEDALKGLNVSYVKEGDMLVVRDAIGFARKLADIAFEEFPELRRDFDEVEALEKLG